MLESEIGQKFIEDEFVEDDHASKTTDVDVGLLFHEGDGVEAEWVGEYV